MDLSVITKGLKDTAVGQLGKWLAEKWGIENEGIMDTFKIDTENKMFHLTLKFKDEEQPREVNIQYSLEEREGKDVLILTPVEGSEEWINKMINSEKVRSFFDRPIELPAMVAMAVKHLL